MNPKKPVVKIDGHTFTIDLFRNEMGLMVEAMHRKSGIGCLVDLPARELAGLDAKGVQRRIVFAVADELKAYGMLDEIRFIEVRSTKFPDCGIAA